MQLIKYKPFTPNLNLFMAQEIPWKGITSRFPDRAHRQALNSVSPPAGKLSSKCPEALHSHAAEAIPQDRRDEKIPSSKKRLTL
jgi:hypothetical protein